MDKAVAKRLLADAGLVQAPYQVLTDRAWTDDPRSAMSRIREGFELPVFVKPARAGSSVGISKVSDWADLETAVSVAREQDPKVVVEGHVDGREIECGVLEREDGRGPEASVCAEIKVHGDHEFYDFAAKYLDGITETVVPADLDPATSERVRAAACIAFEALDCEDYARVDFFVTPDGGVVVNEVNTIPGFTPISMFPQAWAASGVSYPALVDRLLRRALAKRRGLR
jgi:D-alanine-D-alanine ligase